MGESKINILNLFKRKPKKEPFHYHMQDYQHWGNSIRWTDWPKMKVHGHLSRLPEVGDTLSCDFKSGETHQFKFTSIEYCNDPRDMFFASVKPIKTRAEKASCK